MSSSLPTSLNRRPPGTLFRMTPTVATRVRRLDDLHARFTAEIVRVPFALPELSASGREAYLAALRDVLEGLDRARAVLAADEGDG